MSLLGFLCDLETVVRLGEVLIDVDSEELKGFHPFYHCLFNVNWGVFQPPPPPEVNNHLLDLFHI